MSLIVSVSGLRGVVGQSLTAPVAMRFAQAFGTYLRERHDGVPRIRVCVGRDSRPSGPMVQQAVVSALLGLGIEVVDLGIVPTPTVGIMVRHLGCQGGVVVTASHNPLPYNGIKLLLETAMAPPPEVASAVKARFEQQSDGWVDAEHCGRLTCETASVDVHLERVLALVDAGTIARRGYCVVLDSVNGAGGSAGRRLLERLGCRVVTLNETPSGLFARPPEPTPEHLEALCRRVVAEKADVGFAQDPDADRLAIVDPTGRPIGEEYTLALAAQWVLGQRGGDAAANLSTSRLIDDVAGRFGGRVHRSAVGEANVVQTMQAHGCVIGGEGNGGVIDLRVGPIRDSLVAMTHVLAVMAETGRSVGQLADELGRYAMIKDKFEADAGVAERLLEAARHHFADARLDDRDGYRFDFEDGWLHLRTSNTEPIMRVIVESRDPAAAQRYLQTVHQLRAGL